MSLFGWSYPPGCTSRDVDEAVGADREPHPAEERIAEILSGAEVHQDVIDQVCDVVAELANELAAADDEASLPSHCDACAKLIEPGPIAEAGSSIYFCASCNSEIKRIAARQSGVPDTDAVLLEALHEYAAAHARDAEWCGASDQLEAPEIAEQILQAFRSLRNDRDSARRTRDEALLQAIAARINL